MKTVKEITLEKIIAAENLVSKFRIIKSSINWSNSPLEIPVIEVETEDIVKITFNNNYCVYVDYRTTKEISILEDTKNCIHYDIVYLKYSSGGYHESPSEEEVDVDTLFSVETTINKLLQLELIDSLSNEWELIHYTEEDEQIFFHEEKENVAKSYEEKIRKYALKN